MPKSSVCLCALVQGSWHSYLDSPLKVHIDASRDTSVTEVIVEPIPSLKQLQAKFFCERSQVATTALAAGAGDDGVARFADQCWFVTETQC